MFILVVDTGARHGLSAQSYLEDWECTVETVASAAAGIARMSERTPDALIIDLETPDWHTLLEPTGNSSLTTTVTTTVMTTVVVIADKNVMEKTMLELKGLVTELRRLQDNLTQLGLMLSTITHSLKGSLTGLDERRKGSCGVQHCR